MELQSHVGDQKGQRQTIQGKSQPMNGRADLFGCDEIKANQALRSLSVDPSFRTRPVRSV
jgi:hypothetical protein